jgi:hypothetical protein
MSLKVNWTSESERTFNQNLEYLSKEWDNTVINHFLDRVDEVIKKVQINPLLFPLHSAEEEIHNVSFTNGSYCIIKL